ncbi:MAG: LamB/YcsF family protein [Bacteroidota bacterium]|nr:LamB/YcsF family protein [Bacteroidota bacterium]
MGEGIGNDEDIIHYITSANIACGYHAGDEDIMKRTVELCLKYNVAIGAHPSYFDRENFGRKDIVQTPEQVYDLVKGQIELLKKIAEEAKAVLKHVKPHGALYNRSAKDVQVAKAIAKAVKNIDEDLILFGLSGSYSIKEAKVLGLKTKSEVFADRTYQDDGSLTPRTQSNALIEEEEKSIQQVLQMVNEGLVTTVSGKTISIVAETVCIHGDGKNAVQFSKRLHEVLKEADKH